MADKQARRNAYRYAMLRDEQFSLYDAFAKRHGMTTGVLFVANVLFYAKEPLAQREIAARTFQSKQTVSLIVKRLAAQGHAALQESPADRREKLVRMTQAGRDRYGRPLRHITKAEDDAMAMLAPEEQEMLVSFSRRFTDQLRELFDEDEED